jgi:hypothetical protein
MNLISATALSTGRVALVAEIENLSVDSDPIYPSVRVKPFLVPASAPVGGRQNLKGVVLAGQNFSLDFSTGSKVQVHYEADLPFVPAGDYLIGGLVNSNDAVSEDDRRNNVAPELLPVGQLANAGLNPEDEPRDLYSDTYDLRLSGGSANHSWRLFWRGGTPNPYSLNALFLFVDIANRRAYDGDYEKGVGLVSSGYDVDSRGRRTPYDRYSNSPIYSDIPSGRYHMVTWVNHTESYPEVDSNNLDLEEVIVKRARVQTLSDAWFMFATGEVAPKTRTVRLVSDFNRSGTFAIDVAGLPPGVTVAASGGTFSSPDVSFTVDPTAFVAGVHRVPVNILVNGEINPIELIVTVRNTAAATLAFTPDLSATVRKTEFSSTGSIRVSNNGRVAAVIDVFSNSIALVLGATGNLIIPAGGYLDIPVGFETRVQEVGVSNPSIRIGMGETPRYFELNARLRVTNP